jgi:hypothetical protein
MAAFYAHVAAGETADFMHGRVSALFIGASKQLGEFESGTGARLLEVSVPMAVTVLSASLFPVVLRKADRPETSG